jgi:hypothetical protein
VGPIFKQTAEFIRTDPNNKTVLLWSWSSIYDQAVVTRDEVTQARAREMLLKIGAIERKDEKGSVYFSLPPKPKSEPNSGVKSKSDPTATPTASPTPAIEPTPAPKPSI